MTVNAFNATAGSTTTGATTDTVTGTVVCSSARSSIRFAANLKWLFTEQPFLDRFDAAKQFGFAAVEYASPYEFDPDVLLVALKKSDVKQVLINTPMARTNTIGSNGYGCMPEHIDQCRAGVEQAIRYASVLDCKLIHFLAGKVPENCSLAEAELVFRANLFWAAERAAAAGIVLVLECLNQVDAPRYFLRDLEHANTLAQAIPHGNVKLLFDFYHAGMSGVDVLAEFGKYRSQIAHIQVADIPGRHEPGTGALPWNDIAAAIVESNYVGWVGCEYAPIGSTAEGLRWRDTFR